METDTIFPPELFRAILIKCEFNYGMDCVTKSHFAVGHSRASKERSTWKVTSRRWSLSLPQTMGVGPKFHAPIQVYLLPSGPTMGLRSSKFYAASKACDHWAQWLEHRTWGTAVTWGPQPPPFARYCSWISASSPTDPSTSVPSIVVSVWEGVPGSLRCSSLHFSNDLYIPCNCIIVFFGFGMCPSAPTPRLWVHIHIYEIHLLGLS